MERGQPARAPGEHPVHADDRRADELHAGDLRRHVGSGRPRPAAVADAGAHAGPLDARRAACDVCRVPERPSDDGRHPGALRGCAGARVPRARPDHMGRHQGAQRGDRRRHHGRQEERPRLVRGQHDRRAAADPLDPAGFLDRARRTSPPSTATRRRPTSRRTRTRSRSPGSSSTAETPDRHASRAGEARPSTSPRRPGTTCGRSRVWREARRRGAAGRRGRTPRPAAHRSAGVRRGRG